MKAIPRGLIMTFAVVSVVTFALAAMLALPASRLKPLRAGVLELDEPAVQTTR